MKKLSVTLFFFLISIICFSQAVPQNELGKDRKLFDAGFWHTLYICEDSTVWAAGDNTYGQLGDGTNTNSNTPVQVQGLTDVVEVAAGRWTSYALKSDGTVWSWGLNASGEIGDGTTIDKNIPVQVLNITNVVSIDGDRHGMAIRNDSTLWGWGNNGNGLLGDGTTINRLTPVFLEDSVVMVATGTNHTLILKSDSSVWGTGNNANFQLGLLGGPYLNYQNSLGLDSIIKISVGNNHSIALREDSIAYIFGYNFKGQIGDGTTINSLPKVFASSSKVVDVALGGDRTMVKLDNGVIEVCGENTYGSFGNSTNTDSNVPISSNFTNVVAMAVGNSHSIVSDPNGSIRGSGRNQKGQLIQGDFLDENSPTVVNMGCTLMSFGCSMSANANITSSYNGAHISCNGSSDGQASVSVTNGSGSQSYQWSTGGTLASETGMPAGNHYCIVTDGACIDTAFITLTDPPVLTSTIISSNDPSCNGFNDGDATVNPGGGTGSYTYFWSPNGGTGATGIGLSGGVLYTVTVTDANSCQSIDTITLNDPQPLVINATGTTTICEGDSTNLTATGANTYSWDNGAGTGSVVTVSPTVTTVYIVTGTDLNSCQDTAQVTVTVNLMPDTSITQSGFQLTSNQSGATYQWLECVGNSYVNVTGETNQSYTPTTNGSWALAVSFNGCADTSRCIEVNPVGQEEKSLINNFIEIYPNPTSGKFVIDLSEIRGSFNYTVMSSDGKLISQEKDIRTGKVVVDLQAESNGVYFVRVVNRNSGKILRLVKQ